MNTDGFGLKNFIILISVMFVCIAIVIGLYNYSFKPFFENEKFENDSSYLKKLDELLVAAERYQNDNYSSNSNEKTTWILSYSFLKKEKYVDKIMNNGKECNGYVVFKQEGAKISYKPYLKCGDNYKTEGYNECNVKNIIKK